MASNSALTISAVSFPARAEGASMNPITKIIPKINPNNKMFLFFMLVSPLFLSNEDFSIFDFVSDNGCPDSRLLKELSVCLGEDSSADFPTS